MNRGLIEDNHKESKYGCAERLIDKCIKCIYYNPIVNYCECKEEYIEQPSSLYEEYCDYAIMEHSLNEVQMDLEIFYHDSDIDSIIEKFLEGKIY